MTSNDAGKPAGWSDEQEQAFRALEAQRHQAAPPPAVLTPTAEPAAHATPTFRMPGKKTVRWLVFGTMILGAVAIQTGWPMNAFEDEIDSAYVEAEVYDWAQEMRDPTIRSVYGAGPSSVDCPDGVTVEPGRTFNCGLELVNGMTIGVTVSIENSDGDITWRLG